MKIICLHGMGSNASIFESQTHQILQPLREEGHEFVFIDGIVPCEPADDRLKAMYPPPYLAYYTDKSGVSEAIDLVMEHVDEDGPFDGVFAFSQGCQLATAMMCATPNDEFYGHQFAFAVFMGAPSFGSNINKENCKKSLKASILHVIGKHDGYRPQSLEIVDMHNETTKATVLEHDGGHNVPTDMVVRCAITRCLRDKVSQIAAAA